MLCLTYILLSSSLTESYSRNCLHPDPLCTFQSSCCSPDCYATPPLAVLHGSIRHCKCNVQPVSSPPDDVDTPHLFPSPLCAVVTQVAGRLSVDLTLGRFVSYGVAVALSREAVIMAAALSLPKSPFRFPKSPSQSDPDEYMKYARLLCLAFRDVQLKPSLTLPSKDFMSTRPVCHVDDTGTSPSSS